MAKCIFAAMFLVALGCDGGSKSSENDSGVDSETDGSEVQ